jgi:hypothetical protein
MRVRVDQQRESGDDREGTPRIIMKPAKLIQSTAAPLSASVLTGFPFSVGFTPTRGSWRDEEKGGLTNSPIR